MTKETLNPCYFQVGARLSRVERLQVEWLRHSGKGRSQESCDWIPAFAGMTKNIEEQSIVLQFINLFCEMACCHSGENGTQIGPDNKLTTWNLKLLLSFSGFVSAGQSRHPVFR
jgi:hypothetical protein